MKTIDHKQCRQATGQKSFWFSLKERIHGHLSDHIATCPRCQKRLALANRVELALNLLKAQPQALDLLSRANACAVSVLKHSLRNAPQSKRLCQLRPDQNWIEQKSPLLERLMNIAACLFVVLMVRMGVTDSLTDVQTKGKTALHSYYARNLDAQTVDEIFPDDTSRV